MTLSIQDPTNQNSPTLHEALIGASSRAKNGGGAFAFVTTGGIDLYLKDEIFQNFLKNGRFDLVIGIDEITNLKALDSLEQLNKTIPGLSILAFSHDLKNTTFHPKFCWFKNEDGGTLILGSGNLTVKGLRRNWEAFTVLNLTEEKITDVLREWENWRKRCNDLLKTIDDKEVRSKAELNILQRKVKRKIVGEKPDESEKEAEVEEEIEEHPEDYLPWRIENNQVALVAEIPRGGDRWNQANFDQDSFQNFFGGTVWDNSYRILLREVKPDRELANIENRQAVSVQSHNWRFELGAAYGLPYPDQGRPTGVFIRVGPRMFLYLLIMPQSSHYAALDEFLKVHTNVPQGKMRRVQTNVQALQRNCPTLPFWNSI